MRHVALLIPTIDHIAGAERQVVQLACGLAQRSWHVAVVALAGNGSDTRRQLSANNIDYFSLEMHKGLADPRGWWRFQRWLARYKPDLVHAHLPHAAWFARWSRLLTPRQIVLDSIHTASTGTLGRKLGYRLSDWLTSTVTAVSGAAAEAYLSVGLVAAKHLRVIPNGIDLNHWRPDPLTHTQIRGNFGIQKEFLWLAAGRLEPVKDYPTLLRAFAQLNEPAHLLIAGSGTCEIELRSLSDKLNIRSRVTFLGFQPDMLPWMQAADGFVQASLWEGLPMAILEASACELPTVATDVAGSREILISSQAGALSPPGDQDALAQKMRNLMRMPKVERQAIGSNARLLVARQYSLDNVLDLWESLYGELLA